jgi:hypothetical protein
MIGLFSFQLKLIVLVQPRNNARRCTTIYVREDIGVIPLTLVSVHTGSDKDQMYYAL